MANLIKRKRDITYRVHLPVREREIKGEWHMGAAVIEREREQRNQRERERDEG